MEDLAIYEIEADEIKRIQAVQRQVRILFDRDFRERFLSDIRTKKVRASFSSRKAKDPIESPNPNSRAVDVIEPFRRQ